MQISIPPHCKRIKLDVGLSYHAPNMELWLEKDKDLFIIGFEPNVFNLKRIYSDFHLTSHPPEFRKLPHKYLDKEACIMPYALSDKNDIMTFYCTKEDPGCSSLYEPKELSVELKTEVQCYRLDTIMESFPWVTYPYIDALKIDAQGAELSILEGGSNTIEKICYIFLEITTEGLYKNCDDVWEKMKGYLESKGFEFVHIAPRGYNALFKNTRIPKDYIDNVEPIFIDS